MSSPIIHILWPTARLEKMKSQHDLWMTRSSGNIRTDLMVAVKTQQDKESIGHGIICPVGESGIAQHGKLNVIVTGAERLGPVWAIHQLTHQVEGEDGDIIIVATDDFLPPHRWDEFIWDKLRGTKSALMINDGVRGPTDRIMTLPIMTYECLLRLNRIVNHPDYGWHYSDAELYENLDALGLLVDVRGPENPVFEHEHWTKKKREYDAVDRVARKTHAIDRQTFRRRMKMSIEERLTV